MSYPNFFVIGASRSGTTSVYNYLKSHPEIYMSRVKEPRYFAFRDKKVNFQGPADKYTINRSSVPDTAKYNRLFAGADPALHKAIGEASPIYMYSPAAAGEIHKKVPDAKLIAILRDPVQRAYSDYLNMLRLGRDLCESFETVIEQEGQRIRNNWGPFYHYISKGFYHKQLSRYMEYFDASQLHIITHRQFVQHTQKTMEEICRFLEVDASFEFKTFKAYNRSGVPKNMVLHKALTHPLLPFPNGVKNLNIRYAKPEMNAELKTKLYEIFEQDIRKLEKDFGLDVSHWRG